MADDARPAWQAIYALATAAVIGWCLAYGLADWGGWPRLTLDAHTGSWSWVSGPTPRVPINYYGGLLWGTGGAVTAAALAGLGLRLWRRPLPPALIGLLAAWAATAVALAGAYYTWMLWPF